MKQQTSIRNEDIEKVIREYLPHIVHMSLGTCKDGRPWVCEVHFAWDEHLNLYFRSLASRRHSQEIAANPHVAGTIVMQHELGAVPLGLYFEGVATVLSSEAERSTAFGYINERLRAGDSILEESRRPDGHQFYKISVEHWYVFGKIGDSPVEKHHLPWGKHA